MFGCIHYHLAYYGCESCHQGHYPSDEKLGLRPNAMSAELERLAARVGVQMPFAQGGDLFEELTLVSLSDHSISKATQVYGQVVEEVETELYQQTLDSQAMVERDRQAVRPLGCDVWQSGRRAGSTSCPQRTRATVARVKSRSLVSRSWTPSKTPQDDWTIQAYDISYYSNVLKAEEFGHSFWATEVERQADQAVELISLVSSLRISDSRCKAGIQRSSPTTEVDTNRTG